ncbi:MAG: c-type cytochrome [Hyphomicrobiaceae bacterium]
MKAFSKGLTRDHRFGLKPLLTIAIAALVFGLAPIPLSSAEPQKAPRGFDYWQPDWMVRELWGPGRMPKGMMVRLLRHTTYMQYGVPDTYEGQKSTAISNAQTIAAGKSVYESHCAMCHGTDGLGGGKPENALAPSPALLAYMIRRPISVDEYLLWAISDGGEQFNTRMPAFKTTLSRDDIWNVIAYMRSGFADSKTAP